LSDLDKDVLNVTFQHVYQILKFGATPVEKAQLIVNIPTLVDNSGSLVFLYKPRVGSGSMPPILDIIMRDIINDRNNCNNFKHVQT
jgi:hypothetical protein